MTATIGVVCSKWHVPATVVEIPSTLFTLTMTAQKDDFTIFVATNEVVVVVVVIVLVVVVDIVNIVVVVGL